MRLFWAGLRIWIAFWVLMEVAVWMDVIDRPFEYPHTSLLSHHNATKQDINEETAKEPPNDYKEPTGLTKKPEVTEEGQEPTREERIETLVQLARSKMNPEGIVAITMVNSGFIETTQSWFCNVAYMGLTPHVLIIATDDVSYEELSNNNLGFTIGYFPTSNAYQGSLSFGSSDYVNWLKFRTELLVRLLENEIGFLLFETDALWVVDALNATSTYTSQLTVYLDNASDITKATYIGFGFIKARATNMTKTLFKETHERYIVEGGMEQNIFSQLLWSWPPESYGVFLPESYICGLWYKDAAVRKKSTNPVVINNNWHPVTGVAAKTERAKKWRHWFLDDKGQCLSKEETEHRLKTFAVVPE
eukprot:TRINITY_DN2453_c0_g1_i12.p1 TRINITY_DN2453_c0_g1~~TRINITY_DN2453_c0_g1_i12.p1  ORF type:complete len:361 (+),score=52.51 TRINITY_DN2453_c0_g1_i12:168-1250(+)